MNEQSYLNEYYLIDKDIDYLFDVKYKKKDKYVKFVYFGYTNNEKIFSSKPENAFFVSLKHLEGTVIYNNISDIFKFLDFTDDEINQYKSDIDMLIKKEEDLRLKLDEMNLTPDIVYNRKLLILSHM